MERTYQVLLACSSCLIGILAGIYIIRVALRTIRRTSDSDQTYNDDISSDSFQNVRHDNRKLGSSRGTDDRYTSLPNRKKESVVEDIRLISKNRRQESNDDQVYHTLSAYKNVRSEVEPPEDYPRTPVISRQASVPVCPVTIPQVDYSDEEPLEDYPTTQRLTTNTSDKLPPTRPHIVKRSTSLPVMNHGERNLATIQSERRHVTGYSNFHAGRIQPIIERVTDSHTQTAYSVTDQQYDHHVTINIYNHRQKSFPDSTICHQEKNQRPSIPDSPRPDYH